MIPDPMTREELEEAIIAHQNKQTARLLRWIVSMVAGGAMSIIACCSAWVSLRQTVTVNASALLEVRPQIAALERWRERVDATAINPQAVIDLDKRLQRMEDQTMMVLEQLRRIDGKLP